MKISSKMERCGLSPMRKFNPYAQKAKERGIKIYPLNIGQPDVETPAPFYQALKDFDEKVVSYAPSGGLPVYLDAVRDYYRGIGVELERGDILPTTGGSEALQMTFATILDDGDEDGLKDGDVMRMEVRSIDRASYDYLYSMQVMDNAGTNPIANFNGGLLGYFSAYSYVRFNYTFKRAETTQE